MLRSVLCWACHLFRAAVHGYTQQKLQGRRLPLAYTNLNTSIFKYSANACPQTRLAAGSHSQAPSGSALNHSCEPHVKAGYLMTSQLLNW